MTHLVDLGELTVAYGRTTVVHGISLHVDKGEMVALLGANGAGKTTTLRAISNQGVRRQGRIFFNGADLMSRSAPDIARLGIAHVPEGRGTFSDLTVLDNLRIGAIGRKDRDGIEQDLTAMHALFPKLAARTNQVAGALSGGEQQMLAIARALMMRPTLLLLDEPSFGIAPKVTHEIYELLGELRRTRQLTALIVEQNAELALSLVDRAYVLESGAISLEGSSEQLRGDESIRHSYLGQ